MISKVKGTKDYDIVEYQIKDLVNLVFSDICANYGFKMIETPILETSELFKRSVNESEIAKKEMYEFLDKSNRSLCLRPEGTASFVRAFIENKWYTLVNEKFAYNMPMFRYEQPQKGRYRQFYQAGIEFVGPKSYLKDFLIVQVAIDILEALDIKYVLKINSIGDKQTRANYENALTEFLTKYQSQLSQISQQRLKDKKVLRILDDKVDSKLPFMHKAPNIQDYLSKESKLYFEEIKGMLDFYEIEYHIAPGLVRGLDYYDEFVFEITVKSDKAGSQDTLIGGGRYSNLVAELGGPDVSSVGFGFGIDRCIELIRENIIKNTEPLQQMQNQKVDIYFAASVSNENLEKLFHLAHYDLNGLTNFYHMDFHLMKSKKIYEKAKKLNAVFLITDDKLLPHNSFYIKNLITGDKMQFYLNSDGVIDLLKFINDADVFEPEVVSDFIAQYESEV
ncbi:histidine--tRNA ligase [Mycoplasma sp. AC1221]